MMIAGPGGVMYAAAADGSAQGMPQAAPQMAYGAPGMAGGGSMPQGGGGYQMAATGGMPLAGSSVTTQPQAADPMAYAKLAGYGQQGARVA